MISLPENKIDPSSTSSKPEINRNVVVLPQPLGPNKDTILPFCTVKEILSTAAKFPNSFVTLAVSYTHLTLPTIYSV